MNKKFRFVFAMILSLCLFACTTSCLDTEDGWEDTSEIESIESSESEESIESIESSESVESESGDLTENEVGPKALVATATAEEIAAFNAQGVQIYDLTNFQPTGEMATLETAYVFSVTETLEEVQAGEYANWIADYYVSVDAPVEAGKIGLAGSYDEWDNGAWIAFYSPIDVEANQPIGLLASTGGNPWTYEEIVEFVGTFRCGAFDLDDACVGITLKVELRLTNPEDETDIVTICVTEYVFA